MFNSNKYHIFLKGAKLKFLKRDRVAISIMTDTFIKKIESTHKIFLGVALNTETKCGSRLVLNIEMDALLTHLN